MTNLQKQKIQKAIEPYLLSKDITQTKLANDIGISPAVISNIINNKWEHITDRAFLQVWQVVNMEIIDNCYQTSDVKAVFDLFDKVVQHKWMAGLIGDTGMSKTVSLQLLSLRKNVFYFYIDHTITPSVFLKNMLRTLGICYEGSHNAMLSRVAAELNILTHPVVLIDEAAKLSDKMMLMLHSLRDRTNKNCGFILAGMPKFKNELIRHVNRDSLGYAEFFRRINIWHELNGLSTEEISYILQQHGITDKTQQRQFRGYKRIGDLVNAIILYKELATNEVLV